MADAGQSDLKRVKRACADVAVDDAERCQRQKPRIAVSVERSALAGKSRRSSRAGLRGQRPGGANRSAGKNRPDLIPGIWTVKSDQPLADADRLLASFLPQLFRRVDESMYRHKDAAASG